MNSYTDVELGEASGTSSQNIQENLNYSSKSSELLNDFKSKIHEITKLMKGMQFSTYNRYITVHHFYNDKLT